MATILNENKAIFLPPIREDLKIIVGASTREGEPTWTIHDPAQHRFLRIGWLEFEILVRWHLGQSDKIANAISAETTIKATENDVLEVLNFAHIAGLLIPIGKQGTDYLTVASQSEKISIGKWLLKNYIFFRFRLCNPDKILEKCYNSLKWLFTKQFLIAISLLALLSFYLITRQFQTYTHSFLNMFTLEGIFEVGIALSFAKIIHEFGHGLMSKRFACTVPSMGVAFIVMMPVLWTDTTDAWKLTDSRKRIAIDAAGMLAEIILAIIASLAWSILPDGSARTAAFLLSSSTWIITVFININPLMRFDGYYLFSDILDIPNLQERSFSLCRWWLREHLFALGDPQPEQFSKNLKYILLAYGFSCWIYRFFLFMGIAVLVYHLAFKLLGIILMVTEIWWFIVRPIINELKIWKGRINIFSPNKRQKIIFKISLMLIIALIVPIRSHINAFGLLRVESQAVIYMPLSAQLVSIVGNGEKIEKGDILLKLNSNDITRRLEKSRAEVSGLKSQLSGQSFDPEKVAGLQVGSKDLESAIARQRAVESEAEKLVVHAPFSGVMTDVPFNLNAGQYLARREMLGVLIDLTSQLVEAYINEEDLNRIEIGDKAFFMPEDGEAAIALAVADINPTSTKNFEIAELASVNGGGIAVRKEQSGAFIPEQAVYRVLLSPVNKMKNLTQRKRGRVEILGESITILGQIYNRTIALLIRESGF